MILRGGIISAKTRTMIENILVGIGDVAGGGSEANIGGRRKAELGDGEAVGPFIPCFVLQFDLLYHQYESPTGARNTYIEEFILHIDDLQFGRDVSLAEVRGACT